ncbi:MAG: C10 family peptidase [Bacteroidales bacterium]|nr:C10 family peptidase [Bacteroidales bacterium]
MRLILTILCCLLAGLDMEAQRTIRATKHVLAHTNRHGFVLTLERGEQSRLIGYSNECTFEQAQQNPTFRLMLEQMERKAAKIETTYGPVYKPADVKEEVPPLCTDLWHQYAPPYWDLCPIIEGDTCCTGCVATALAQAMRYHRWPLVGKGSHSYTDSTGCKQVLTADFSSHHYDWDYMIDDYQPGNYTEREGRAVALLMSDCGIAVNMRYGVETSGARSIYQASALATYFDYDPGLQMRFRSFYPQVEWDSLLFTELSEGRPLIVSGWRPNNAHSFICDGYDREGLFHISFGNGGGYGNGFYYFNFLTPDMPEWMNYKDIAETGFNLLQSITTGVRPRIPGQESPQHYEFGFSHLEWLGDDRMVVHHLGNLGWNKHEGRVGIAMVNAQCSMVNLLYTYDREFLLEEVDDTTYTDTIRIDIPAHITDGTYRIVPVFEDGDGTWKEARTMVGIPNFLRCSVYRGDAMVTEPTDALFDLKVTAIDSFPDILLHWTRPRYSITLRNEGSEYSGRLYVALYTDRAPDQNVIIARVGVSLTEGQEAAYPFRSTVFSTPPIGTYHLRLLADIDLFTDSLVTIYDDPDRNIQVYKTLPDGIEPFMMDDTATLTYYDLTGRRISVSEARQRRQPYIMSDGKRFRKILP